MPRILVFQHIDIEHPGIFRDFFAADGVEWDAVELDAGESIPALDAYDALWVMGGPMDVWEESEHPWLIPEKAAIREAVIDREMPYFGFCLGHQLLAEATGGSVGPSRTPEIGILTVDQTSDGQSSPLFSGLPSTMNCLQWHSAEVTDIPPQARVLASSAACDVQAMQIGERAFSVQYHVEIGPQTVSEWGAVPAYEEALEKQLGPGALGEFDALAKQHMSEFAAVSKTLYDNWMQAVFATA